MKNLNKGWVKFVLILVMAFVFWIISQSGSVAFLLFVLLVYFEFFFNRTKQKTEKTKKSLGLGD